MRHRADEDFGAGGGNATLKVGMPGARNAIGGARPAAGARAREHIVLKGNLPSLDVNNGSHRICLSIGIKDLPELRFSDVVMLLAVVGYLCSPS